MRMLLVINIQRRAVIMTTTLPDDKADDFRASDPNDIVVEIDPEVDRSLMVHGGWRNLTMRLITGDPLGNEVAIVWTRDHTRQWGVYVKGTV